MILILLLLYSSSLVAAQQLGPASQQGLAVAAVCVFTLLAAFFFARHWCRGGSTNSIHVLHVKHEVPHNANNAVYDIPPCLTDGPVFEETTDIAHIAIGILKNRRRSLNKIYAEGLQDYFDLVSHDKATITPENLMAHYSKTLVVSTAWASNVCVLLAAGQSEVTRYSIDVFLTSVAASDSVAALFIFYDLNGSGLFDQKMLKQLLDDSFRSDSLKLLSPHFVAPLTLAQLKRVVTKHAIQSTFTFTTTTLFNFATSLKTLKLIRVSAKQPRKVFSTFHLGAFCLRNSPSPSLARRSLFIASTVYWIICLALVTITILLQLSKNGAVIAARMGGTLINFHLLLTLFTMMKTTHSYLALWLRRTSLLAFATELHTELGKLTLLYSLVHTIAHTINYSYFLSAFSFTLTNTTGIILDVVLIAMGLGYACRAKKYTYFTQTHHLHWLFWCLSVVHAPEPWKWLIVPLFLFCVDFALSLPSTFRQLAATITTYDTGLVKVVIKKPEQFFFKSGSYATLCFPSISRIAWHPFSLACSEQSEELTFVVRSGGIWTTALAHSAVSVTIPSYINGPYWAPTVMAYDYNHSILVGLGIGITPLTSLLATILEARDLSRFPSRLDLIAVVNHRDTLLPFGKLFLQAQQRLAADFILRSRLSLQIQITAFPLTLDLAPNNSFDLSDSDLGRPDWEAVISQLLVGSSGVKAALFFCGPNFVAADISHICLSKDVVFFQELFG